MFKTRLYFTLSIFIFLTACGGNSSSSASDDNSLDLGSGNDTVICPSGSTFEVEGVELTTQVYDTNQDGCLSGFEYSSAVLTAQRIIEQREKELEFNGVNAGSSISRIHNIKVIGSSEVSDRKIQLHTNIDNGNFHISFETYSTSSSDESLKLYFDDESAEGKSGSKPPLAMTFPLPPLIGDISYAFGCKYLVELSVKCDTLVVTDTDNIGQNVMTLDINLTFPLGLTFSEQALPQDGYIIATFCDESGEEAVCLNNYAQVPVSFN